VSRRRYRRQTRRAWRIVPIYCYHRKLRFEPGDPDAPKRRLIARLKVPTDPEFRADPGEWTDDDEVVRPLPVSALWKSADGPAEQPTLQRLPDPSGSRDHHQLLCREPGCGTNVSLTHATADDLAREVARQGVRELDLERLAKERGAARRRRGAQPN